MAQGKNENCAHFESQVFFPNSVYVSKVNPKENNAWLGFLFKGWNTCETRRKILIYLVFISVLMHFMLISAVTPHFGKVLIHHWLRKKSRFDCTRFFPKYHSIDLQIVWPHFIPHVFLLCNWTAENKWITVREQTRIYFCFGKS